MDRCDYEHGLTSHLKLPNYSEVTQREFKQANNKFKELLLQSMSGYKVTDKPNGKNRDEYLKQSYPDTYKEYTNLRQSDGNPGKFYLAAKTHKKEIPNSFRNEEERKSYIASLRFRPIAPGYDSIDSKVSRKLVRVLQLLPRPKFEVKNSRPVLKFLRQNPFLANQTFMFSLDVEQLYPSVPIDESINHIQQLLKSERVKSKVSRITKMSPETILKLLEFCLKNTFVQAEIKGENRIYKQDKGVAMGKALSPEIACQFMGKFEENLKAHARTSGGNLPYICRYIDDFYGLWMGSLDSFLAFTNLLNGLHPAIKLTHEIENNGSLPFLDMMIHRDESGFHTSVYRKACFSGRLQPFHSHTDRSYLLSSLKSYLLRAKRYNSGEVGLRQEINYIKELFLSNGYPIKIIDRQIRNMMHTRPSKVPRGDPRPKLTMEYSGPLFHRVKSLIKRHCKVDLVAKSSNNTRSRILSRCKTHTDPLKASKIIYGINCECGNVYVGETKRALETRIKEHESAWRKTAIRRTDAQQDGPISSRTRHHSIATNPAEPDKISNPITSAFCNHPRCQPLFKDAIIIDREGGDQARRVREAIWIARTKAERTVMISPNDLNRNCGIDIPNTWIPAISNLRLPAKLKAMEDPSR